MNKLRFCLNNLASIKSVNYEGRRYIKRWVAPTQMRITYLKKLQSQPEPKRSNFIDWNREAELYAFNKRLSEKFLIDKLDQAFTYKSYLAEELKKQEELGIKQPKLYIKDNENLIKMGTRITSKAIYNYLMTSLPNVPDSLIISLHNYLMSEEILAEASLHIGTKDIILTAEHPVEKGTLASTFLALVGALAESVNIDHAGTFVRDFLIVGLADKDLSEIWNPSKPFELLKNIFKERNMQIEPRIIRQAGKNTIIPAYKIAVYSNKHFLGSGFGQTIDEARNVAAMNALCKMFGLLDSSQPLQFNKKIDMSL